MVLVAWQEFQTDISQAQGLRTEMRQVTTPHSEPDPENPFEFGSYIWISCYQYHFSVYYVAPNNSKDHFGVKTP